MTDIVTLHAQVARLLAERRLQVLHDEYAREMPPGAYSLSADPSHARRVLWRVRVDAPGDPLLTGLAPLRGEVSPEAGGTLAPLVSAMHRQARNAKRAVGAMLVASRERRRRAVLRAAHGAAKAAIADALRGVSRIIAEQNAAQVELQRAARDLDQARALLRRLLARTRLGAAFASSTGTPVPPSSAASTLRSFMSDRLGEKAAVPQPPGKAASMPPSMLGGGGGGEGSAGGRRQRLRPVALSEAIREEGEEDGPRLDVVIPSIRRSDAPSIRPSIGDASVARQPTRVKRGESSRAGDGKKAPAPRLRRKLLLASSGLSESPLEIHPLTDSPAPRRYDPVRKAVQSMLRAVVPGRLGSFLGSRKVAPPAAAQRQRPPEMAAVAVLSPARSPARRQLTAAGPSWVASGGGSGRSAEGSSRQGRLGVRPSESGSGTGERAPRMRSGGTVSSGPGLVASSPAVPAVKTAAAITLRRMSEPPPLRPEEQGSQPATTATPKRRSRAPPPSASAVYVAATTPGGGSQKGSRHGTAAAAAGGGEPPPPSAASPTPGSPPVALRVGSTVKRPKSRQSANALGPPAKGGVRATDHGNPPRSSQ